MKNVRSCVAAFLLSISTTLKPFSGIYYSLPVAIRPAAAPGSSNRGIFREYSVNQTNIIAPRSMA